MVPIFDRESIEPGPDGPPTLPGNYTNYNDLQQASDVVRFSWDWTFSPTKLNHFYAGGNNWRQNHNPPQEIIGNWKDKFCLGNVPDCKIRFTPTTTTSPGFVAPTPSNSAVNISSPTITASVASASPDASVSAISKPGSPALPIRRRVATHSPPSCSATPIPDRSTPSASSASSSIISAVSSRTIGVSARSSS